MARDIEKPLLRELAKAEREFRKKSGEAMTQKIRYDLANEEKATAREKRDSIALALLNLRGQRETGVNDKAPILDEAVKFADGEAPVA